MNKLLFAHFARLKKDKTFWAAIIFMFLIGLMLIINLYDSNMKYDDAASLDFALFNFTVFIPFAIAAFCSLFLGTEYSDGTIRNKLTIGHSRYTIYFSSLIISIIASVLMCLSWFLSMVIFGIPFVGVPEIDAGFFLIMLFAVFMMLVAFCSLLTMLSMLCQNKALAAVIGLLGVLILLLAASYINARLSAPEFYDGYVFIDNLGNQTSEQIPNPGYLEGSKRAVYTFFFDFLPTGQAMQYSNMSIVNENGLWQMPLYDVLITAVTTILGLCFFRRKDIK